MQPDHILKKVNFDLLTPPQGPGMVGAVQIIKVFERNIVIIFLAISFQGIN